MGVESLVNDVLLVLLPEEMLVLLVLKDLVAEWSLYILGKPHSVDDFPLHIFREEGDLGFLHDEDLDLLGVSNHGQLRWEDFLVAALSLLLALCCD